MQQDVAARRDDSGDGSSREGGAISVACVAGAPCSLPGNACQSGIISCASGMPACVSVANAPNGAPCGTDEVCFEGACTTCKAGVACSPNSNACQTGRISCSTGQPACVQTGDMIDGKACASGICCGGVCAACGAPTRNEAFGCSGKRCTFTCKSGYTLCGSACVDATSDSSACGPSCTTCPAGWICRKSQCVACMPGAACNPGGNVCQTGTMTCSTDGPMCTPMANAPDGTACGAGYVCSAGVCMACAPESACTPSSNPCLTGTMSCATGPVCVPTRNASDGTMCPGGGCCRGGCEDTTSNGNACGASCRMCPSGARCVKSQCTIDYGNYMQFPCAGSTINAGLLAAQAVSVTSAVTVTALGIIGQPGMTLTGILVLYADSGGAPGKLLTYTGQVSIPPGKSEFGISTSVPIAPDTYWIAAEFTTSASPCNDGTQNGGVNYVQNAYPNVPVQFGPSTHTAFANFNFYLVGTD